MFRSFRLAVSLAVLPAVAVAALIAFTPRDDAAAQGRMPRGSGTDYWEPRWMDRHMWGQRGMHGDMQARMRRHWTYMHVGLPKEYDGARSTVEVTDASIGEGGKLYAENCASCHGKTGLGDGEAGKSLTPSPALLAYLIQRPMAADEYLLWSISEGGKEFKTDMPAFKDKLSREQIWKIVAYMREGFPKVDADKK